MQRAFADVEKGLIQGQRFDQMSVVVKYALHSLALNPVLFHIGRHYDEIRAKPKCVSHGHGGVQAIFTRNVVAGSNHAASTSAASHRDGYIAQTRVIAHFYRCIKAVAVAMNNFAHSVLWPLADLASGQ